MLKNAFWGLPVKFNGPNHALVEASKIKTFLDAFTEFITNFELMVKKGKRSNETLKHWLTTKTQIAEFVNYKYRLKDIDLTGMLLLCPQFYKYMTLETTQPLSEVTAKMHVKKTRQIVGQCVTDEIITKNR